MGLIEGPGYDAAPCEIEFVLSGCDVSIKRSSRKILSLINRLTRGKITVKELQAMSDTPYTKLRT